MCAASPWKFCAGSPDTLVVGLGNPILGDDGVGWRVAELVERTLVSPPGEEPAAEVDCVCAGGLSLMERMIGHRHAIVIDAVVTGRWPIGCVRRLALGALPDPVAGHSGSPHDTSLKTALDLGRTLGARLPDDVIVVAIEVPNTSAFSQELTPAVAAAVPQAARLVLDTLIRSAAGEPVPKLSNEDDGPVL